MTELSEPFTHTLLVASPDELAVAAVPFIRAALDAGDAVYVNLAPETAAPLRGGLGADAARVAFTDTTTWEPHPVRRLRAVHAIADRELARGARGLRFFGECAWPHDDAVLTAEWERFDAALNRALTGLPMTMACVYDPACYPAAVVDRARSAHPHRGLGPSEVSGDYLEPEQLLAAARPDHLPVPHTAVRLSAPSTATVRSELLALLLGTDMGGPGATLDADVADALLVSATELVTNAQQAGATSVEVACWREGPWALLQVDDDGPGLPDSLAGYRRPSPDALGGRGLWITRQLVDALDIATGEWGTSIRLRLRCATGPAADALPAASRAGAPV